MMRRSGSILLLTTLVFLLAVAPLLANETVLEQPMLNSGKATLHLASDPLKAMTEIPFALTLTDDKGQEITDATVSISMDMPAMPMPPNNPVAVWENGAYRGKAIFTMAGAWQIKITLAIPGTSEQTVIFDIDQVMM